MLRPMRARTYAITVEGRLSSHLAFAFDRAAAEPAAGGRTRFVTEPFDQAQLRGLLDRLADFGLEIVKMEELACAR